MHEEEVDLLGVVDEEDLVTLGVHVASEAVRSVTGGGPDEHKEKGGGGRKGKQGAKAGRQVRASVRGPPGKSPPEGARRDD